MLSHARRIGPISINVDHVKANLIGWLKRKVQNGGLAPRIKIPHKTAVALGLPTRWAVLNENGTLQHESGEQIVDLPHR